MNAAPLARALILCGAILIAAGLAILAGRHLPWLGRLPGDITVERPGFRFYFPLASSLLLSVVLTLLLYAFTRRR